LEVTPCKHNFVFLRTSKWTDYSGNYNTGYFRIDYYYCNHCLEYKEVKRSDYCRDTPDWYRS
jgi:hypothetical protein